MTGDDIRWWEQAACATAPPAARHEFVVSDTNKYRRADALANQLAVTKNARAVCNTCPAARRCLIELWDDEYAVAGGTVPAQRTGPRPAHLRPERAEAL